MVPDAPKRDGRVTRVDGWWFAGVAVVVVRGLEWVPSIGLDSDTYMRSVVPIGALYALTLWLGNSAYLYLSVSFIQMLKVRAQRWREGRAGRE